MAGMLKYLYVPLFDRFTELSWRGRAAWIALCFFAQWSKAEGNVGRCWPSQETLARMMGVSISTVIRGLKELRELGIVRCEERSDGETCGYVLQIEGVCLSDRGGLSLRQTNNTNNNTNNTDTLTRERFERLFSGLWEQFRQ
ncbi:MAG: helix-turn-helix domain-containing protein, partial [Synergistaceae bacterium]|nr:helix-turn-helix domain-containing protein [Synergistaceae bacterium]